MTQEAPERPVELVTPPVPGRSPDRRARRIASRAVLIAAAILTGLCLLLVVGAWRDDHAIGSRLGRTTAEVTSVSTFRAFVRYTTPDGDVHIPQHGVLYPSGLEPGQLVLVEFDTAHPDLVRVSGRGMWLTLLPVAVVIAVTWAVAGGMRWLLRRRSP